MNIPQAANNLLFLRSGDGSISIVSNFTMKIISECCYDYRTIYSHADYYDGKGNLLYVGFSDG